MTSYNKIEEFSQYNWHAPGVPKQGWFSRTKEPIWGKLANLPPLLQVSIISVCEIFQQFYNAAQITDH